MKQKLFLIAFLCYFTVGFSQSNSVASGGTETGSNGSSTYSIGQTFYSYATGSNGSVSEGLQQPFEITTLGNDNFPEIILQLKVFPNPTTSFVTLSVGDANFDKFSFKLFDLNGKSISVQKIQNVETKIEMESLPSAVYFLNVMEGSEVKKSFKIVKK
jgi:Secretion system C-terminal sorting domain